MEIDLQKLPLRDGVGIVVLNSRNKVLVDKRIDNPKNFWQIPQGGIDKNENYFEAAIRELKEETSITSVTLIREIDDFITYLLPKRLLGIIWKGKFKGQKQKWFIMKFNGSDEEININTAKPEFLEWKWIDIDQLNDAVVDFKKEVYQKVTREIRKVVPN